MRRRLPDCWTGRQASSASISAPTATARTASAIMCGHRALGAGGVLLHHQHFLAQHAGLARSSGAGGARRFAQARAGRAQPLPEGNRRRCSSSSRPISPTTICRNGARDRANNVDGIIVSNTTLARDGLRDAAFARETGGLSGRPLFARSTRMLARVYQLTRRQAAADRRRRHLVGRGGARQDRGRRLAAPALYRARVRRSGAGRPHQAGLIEAMASSGSTSSAPLIGRRAGEWAERVT